MKSTLRIAQVKFVPERGNLVVNHNKLMSVLGEIAPASVDVVVTTECMLDGYVVVEEGVTSKTLCDYAVNPADNPYVHAVSGWARQNSTWVILGCNRIAPEGVFNTALILNRQGKLAGWYDKTHCQVHDRKYVSGQQLNVFDSDFGPFGLMICADRRWPEVPRTLALKGARIIFNPTAGMHNDLNLRMMQTRSFESEVFIAFTHPRQSLVTDPEGNVLHNETGEDVRFSVCEVDLSKAEIARAAASAHLKDRRPDLYSK